MSQLGRTGLTSYSPGSKRCAVTHSDALQLYSFGDDGAGGGFLDEQTEERNAPRATIPTHLTLNRNDVLKKRPHDTGRSSRASESELMQEQMDQRTSKRMYKLVNESAEE